MEWKRGMPGKMKNTPVAAGRPNLQPVKKAGNLLCPKQRGQKGDAKFL